MSIENWLIGIVCAVIGGVAGHILAYRLYNQRVQSLEHAMNDEFEFLRLEMERWFPKLLVEHQNPIQDVYSVIPAIDLSLVENIVIELASSKQRVTREQRKFIIRLKFLLAHAVEIDSQRGILIKNLFETESVMNFSEKRVLGNRISFFTAQLLIDCAETIFYLIKLSEEKRHFEISDHHTCKDYIEVACKQASVEVQPAVWRMVYAQTGHTETQA
ncbi:hypothetical protein ACTJ2V_003447 [Vibrio cholerae]